MGAGQDASTFVRLMAAAPLMLLAAFAAYIAWSELPHEQARDTLNALSDGTDINREAIEAAQLQLATAANRMPMNGSLRVAQGRLALSLVRYTDGQDAIKYAAGAAAFYRDGLRRKPNARGAWRGLFAAEYVSRGPSPQLARVFDGLHLFDSGAPFSALTMLDTALRHPEFLSAERLEQVLGLAQPLVETWYMRRPVARVYLSLPETGQLMLRQALDDGDAFADWVDRVVTQ